MQPSRPAGTPPIPGLRLSLVVPHLRAGLLALRLILNELAGGEAMRKGRGVERREKNNGRGTAGMGQRA